MKEQLKSGKSPLNNLNHHHHKTVNQNMKERGSKKKSYLMKDKALKIFF
jgi:hypothetical protein